MPWKGQPIRTGALTDKLQLEETPGGYRVLGREFAVSFDRTHGTMGSLSISGAELLAAGPRPSVWRAATDNDGYRHNPTPLNRALGHWLEAGLDNLKHSVVSMSARRNRDGTVCVSIRSKAVGSHTKFWLQLHHEYRVLCDGTIRINNVFTIGKHLPELARVGLRLALSAGFENLSWFGRGPHESYCDRSTGAPIALYRSTVDDQYFPYILPQETGNHTDVRWFALDNGSAGLVVAGRPLMEFSALHYTAHDLYNSRHTNELRRRRETFLHIDIRQRGLGGASCGPDTLKKYRLTAKSYRLRYAVRPFVVGREDPSALARRIA